MSTITRGMNTKSSEVLIHSQRAFHECRGLVKAFEKDSFKYAPFYEHPNNYRESTKRVLECFQKNTEIDNICLKSFNNVRECMFKADGYSYNCARFLREFRECQKDPKEFREFLMDSTPIQLKDYDFDFSKHRGNYNNLG